MKLSILERVLTSQRAERRMVGVGEYVPPVAAQVSCAADTGPWLSTSSKGVLTPTSHRGNHVLQAFFECYLEEEDDLLGKWFDQLKAHSETFGWSNRAPTPAAGVKTMLAMGVQPKFLVMPFEDMNLGISEEAADKVSLSKGCVVETEGLKVISARHALPSGCAMLFADRAETGHYTRVADFLAITLCRADRSVLLVSS